MRLVGFTYRDYLKYHKYLVEQKKKESTYVYTEEQKKELEASYRIFKRIDDLYKKIENEL